MKKKLLVSLFINIAYSSDTIFKLIEPYKISNNTHINTLLILSGGICVDKIRSTILNKLSPSNETNQATEKKNFKIAKITLITSLQILFSPIVVFPLLLNVIHKKQVVGWDMLAKYFCIELGSGILIKSTHHFVSQNIGFIKDPLKNRFENNQLKKEHSTALKCYNKALITNVLNNNVLNNKGLSRRKKITRIKDTIKPIEKTIKRKQRRQ